MPNLAVLEEIEKGELIIAIDDGSCSDLREKTSELAKIGFQPKRDAGEAQEQPEPGTTGPVTYDAAAETLSVAVMPDHSTTLHSFRQPLGGAPELAGSSPTTTVSVVQFGPLTPGVTYEFWLVGHTQSAGEGPQSNHVTHAVPVGPYEADEWKAAPRPKILSTKLKTNRKLEERMNNGTNSEYNEFRWQL